MDKSLLLQFIEELKLMNEREYIFTLISYHIAPTLWKIKPSSIISLRNGIRPDYSLWLKYKEDYLYNFNIKCLEINREQEGCILMFYYEELLEPVLLHKDCIDFLSRFGYSKNMSLREKLLYLKLRYGEGCPHEMGIFLGFPLGDVRDFIENPEKRCLLIGYWKVYNEVESARKTFDCFDEAKYSIIANALKYKDIINYNYKVH